jgi:hypothetical protein
MNDCQSPLAAYRIPLTALFAPLEATLRVTSRGEYSAGKLQLANYSLQPRDVLVSLLTSQELVVRDNIQHATLLPGETKLLPVYIKNVWGVEGSPYALFAGVQWSEDGVQNSFVTAVQCIAGVRHPRGYFLVAAVLALATVGVLLYLFAPVPASSLPSSRE